MISKYVAIVLVVLCVSACHIEPVRDENSPRSRLPVGSSVILHQALNVPAGHSRVFIQHGGVVAKIKLNQFQPHCDFEVREVSSGKSSILPDTFVVTSVMEDEEEVVQGPHALPFASRFADLELQGGGAVNVISKYVRYTLRSVHQPEVMRITCHAGFSELWQAKTPSINEIRQTLGVLVTLRQLGAI